VHEPVKWVHSSVPRFAASAESALYLVLVKVMVIWWGMNGSPALSGDLIAVYNSAENVWDDGVIVWLWLGNARVGRCRKVFARSIAKTKMSSLVSVRLLAMTFILY
jgi:hypothetical protein